MDFLSCLIAPFKACFNHRTSCDNFAYSKLESNPNLSPEGNPLPNVIHKYIRKSDLAPGRLVIVGDVHGCLSELFQLLDALDFKFGHDNLLLTGDMVNKGPRSQEVVAAVRALSEGPVWAVRGNNDDGALAAWFDLHMGIAPRKKKHHWVGQLLPEDVNFLCQLPFSLRVEGYNLLVVHAGLLPGKPLEQQDLATLTKMRDVLQGLDGSLVGLERACEGSQPWAEHWQGPEHIIFGHDSARHLQGYDYCTGIDTACCSGGQLTACVLPALAELQSNPQFVRARKLNQATSLRDMGGFLVSVPSGTNYQQ